MDYVPDTSVIIEKLITKLIKNKEIGKSIIIHTAVLAELEHQANKRQETGFLGLEEIQELQELKNQGKIDLKFLGSRPTMHQIKLAKSGEIDSLIREVAQTEGATLVTADRVQAEVAYAMDIPVKFCKTTKPTKRLSLEKLFDAKTMSVHLKENTYPLAKKGFPGNWQLTKISNKLSSNKEMKKLANEIVEKARQDSSSFVEISREGSTVVQYQNHRIVIVKPPISDGWEITAVKPIKKLNLKDYKIPAKILERLKESAKGIIVAGETGSGKSTFAQALAEFYASQNKIVKTVESPRDLVLSPVITQYSKNFTSSTEIHDILFLSRPDNIIFDEIRDTPDFKLYTDLRLAGSNCLGVLHAATPIDAVQRFIGRIETGMIPSVLDTIIFIDSGKIKQLLTLKMTIKVPTGMTEADLARPVVEVISYEDNSLEYEIYSYGEETVVIPVKGQSYKAAPAQILAAELLENKFQKYTQNVKVELKNNNRATVYIPESDMARIIGKQGKHIEHIEKELGISIDLKPLTIEVMPSIDFVTSENKKSIIFQLPKYYKKSQINIYIENEFLLKTFSDNNAEVRINKKTPSGRKLISSLDSKKKIEFKTG